MFNNLARISETLTGHVFLLKQTFFYFTRTSWFASLIKGADVEVRSFSNVGDDSSLDSASDALQLTEHAWIFLKFLRLWLPPHASAPTHSLPFGSPMCTSLTCPLASVPTTVDNERASWRQVFPRWTRCSSLTCCRKICFIFPPHIVYSCGLGLCN
jgi:hypothetical protein